MGRSKWKLAMGLGVARAACGGSVTANVGGVDGGAADVRHSERRRRQLGRDRPPGGVSLMRGGAKGARVRRRPRGKYVAKGLRSLQFALIEPSLWAHLRSSETVNDARRALVRARRWMLLIAASVVACGSGSSEARTPLAEAGAEAGIAIEPTSLVIGGPSNGTESGCTVDVNDNGFEIRCNSPTNLTAGVSGVTSGASVQNLAVTAIWQTRGAPAAATYTLATLKNALADLETNLGGKWRAATPSTGSVTITLTEVRSAGLNYAVHGTYAATLPATPDSSVKGDETFKATF